MSKYLLLGMGKSNQAVSRYFDANNIDYITYDDNNKVELKEDYEVVVKSGGVKPDHPLLKNKFVISDLELFYLYSKKKNIICVTGTNGKTTTVSLIKEIIDDIDLGGNIGYPLMDFCSSDKDIIIEASSYMLDNTYLFKAKYNVILNISCNHLDYHQTFENYYKAKFKMFNNLSVSDYIIYNYDDEIIREHVQKISCHKIPISRKTKVKGIYLLNNYIYLYDRPIMSVAEIHLEGDNNLYNVMASIITCYLYGINIYKIRCGVQKFYGLKYRMELVLDQKVNEYNIKVYNDSKATNIMAFKNAFDTIQKKCKENNYKIILICGGQKRDNVDIYQLLCNANLSIDYIDTIYCFGSAREEYYNYYKIHSDCIKVSSISDIKNLKIEGNRYILFSPGAPSFDEFKNYQERGIFFEKLLKTWF